MTESTAPSDILKDVFGFSAFRPDQEQIIETIMQGQSVLAVMPTGSGKSLCYQIPAISLGGLTVVVSPLVALMRDQVAALQLAGVAAATINSSQDRHVNVAAWRLVESGATKILYLSPERLMTERMLAALGRLDLRLLVIDEAHCVSQWGPSFRTEYEDLTRLKTIFPACRSRHSRRPPTRSRDWISRRSFCRRDRALSFPVSTGPISPCCADEAELEDPAFAISRQPMTAKAALSIACRAKRPKRRRNSCVTMAVAPCPITPA